MGKILKNYNDLITSYYGNREYMLNGTKVKDFHLGIDIGGNLDYITAFETGKVIDVVSNIQGYVGGGSYGNYIIIDHGNNIKTRYAHLKYQSITVKKGDTITKGSTIGYMGATGTVTGAHCHFEVIINNSTTDPLPYYNGIKKILSEQITPTVIKDNNKNQLKILVDDLRVRDNYNTKANILGLAKQNGIYNYYDIKQNEQYTWYKISQNTNQWVANKNNWCEIYPKEMEDEKMIEELKKQIENLNKTINDKDKKIKELEAKINEDEYETFIALKTDNYYIKLNENEILTYKKV